jgi:hypothetical protein
MIAAAARRARAAISLVALTLLVASGVLAKHHEADVTHVTDAQTGITSHASEVDCHDGIPVAHLHEVSVEPHPDVCGLLGAVHHSERVAIVLAVTTLPQLAPAAAPLAIHHVQSPLLLAAPKTSPPAHA